MVANVGQIMSVELLGFPSLNEKVERLKGQLADMRPFWELVISDFYKTEKQIFGLSGPGQYADLSPAYKKRKERMVGFAYPILLLRGALALSLTTRNAEGSVAVATPSNLLLGTRISYAKYHHSTEPRTKMPRRPLWDESDDSPMVQRWKRMADEFFKKVAKGAFDGEAGSGSQNFSGG